MFINTDEIEKLSREGNIYQGDIVICIYPNLYGENIVDTYLITFNEEESLLDIVDLDSDIVYNTKYASCMSIDNFKDRFVESGITKVYIVKEPTIKVTGKYIMGEC